MQRFTVSVEKYYDQVLARGNDGIKTCAIWAEACRKPINELIARYDLAGKSILSLGAGEAFEEFWYSEAGCRLTLNDINPAYENALSRLAPAAPPSPNLDYVVGDAAEFLRGNREHFDLLYVSSFHPDEIRREKIQQEFIRGYMRHWLRIVSWVGRRFGFRHSIASWPRDAQTYVDTLFHAFEHVRPGGMIIFQHYRGGVSLDSNPHYVEDVASQFSQRGATLLEVFAFRKSPGNILVVASKENEIDAAQSMKRILQRPPLTVFHGRFANETLKSDVVKVYEFGNMNVSPATAFA